MSLGFGKNIKSYTKCDRLFGIKIQTLNHKFIKFIMSGIIQEVIEKIQLKPWIIDLYRLKNILFTNTHIELSKLDEDTLESYFNILNFISFLESQENPYSRYSNVKKTERKLSLSLVWPD